MRIFYSALILLFSLLSAQAQNRYSFEQGTNTKVFVGPDSLLNPWAGGLNYPIVNNFDFNFDNLQDLLVYDRNGNRILPMVQEIRSNDTIYRYHPEYIKAFPLPRGEGAFLLMRDYNCDGKPDIFFSNGLFIKVWENTSNNGQISFSPANGGLDLNTDYMNSGVSKLYISRADLPDINDVDGDGDLDILTFGNGGVRLEFHENVSNCGLQFVQTDNCWGQFIEDGFYRTVELDGCSGGNKRANAEQSMHAGSGLLSWDVDNDTDPDLMLSNVSYNNLSLLINGGDIDSVIMVSQDTMYPPAHPVDLFVFPAPFRAEATFDSSDDLILSSFSSATSGSPDMSSNHRGVWRYENTGTNTNPNFIFKEDNFLQKDMIDFGAASLPRLADLNGDSLNDLILAIGNRFIQPGISSSQLYYYENTGTANIPEFTLMDTNFADILQYSLGTELCPAFGDLDDDGDLDMIMGTVSGYFHYFENIGSATAPSFSLTTPIITNTDVGADAAPYLYDLDEDGDLDLFVGNEQGRVYYFKNSSNTSPSFSLESNFFAAANVSQLGLSGNAVPVFYEDSLGSSLFIGSRQKGVVQYDDVDTVAQLSSVVSDTFGNASFTSANSDQSILGITKRSGRNQFLIRASELQAKGYLYGYINSIGINVIDNGGSILSNGFSVKIKNTNATTVDTFDNNFPTPYPLENFIYGFGNGWNTIPLNYPHLWDGQSNLLIEFCFSGNFPADDIKIALSDAGFNAHAWGNTFGYNNLQADGCSMPYLQSSNRRPDVQLNLTPAAIPVPSNQQFDLYAGERTTADFADLNDDGYLDAIAGNLSGGLHIYWGKVYDVGIDESMQEPEAQIHIYPNPSRGEFQLDIDPSLATDYDRIKVFNMRGECVWQSALEINGSYRLPSALSDGLYLGLLEGPQDFKRFKLLLRKN